MNRIKDKTAFITGATSGIGKACAKALAKKNVNLILSARRGDKLKELAIKLETKYKINVKILILDVQKRDEVDIQIKEILKNDTIDFLLNNAGLALGLDKIDAGNIDDWEEMIDTNIKGLLYVSRVIIPHMRDKNNGHIINIGSIAGHMAYPNGNVYCATKAAVHSLSEGMNIDLVGTNIKVSNVAPGAVETEFSNIRFHGDDKKADSVYEGYHPLKAKDIADLIVYILNTPSHVNIQNILITPTAQRNPYVLDRNN